MHISSMVSLLLVMRRRRTGAQPADGGFALPPDKKRGQAWRRQEQLMECGARDQRIQLLFRHGLEVWSKVVVVIIASSSSTSSSSSSSSTPSTRGLEMRRGIMRICSHFEHFHRRHRHFHQKQPVVNLSRQSCG